MNNCIADKPPIVVKVAASIYSWSYELHWDYEKSEWIKIKGDDPPLGIESIVDFSKYYRE